MFVGFLALLTVSVDIDRKDEETCNKGPWLELNHDVAVMWYAP